MMAKYSKEQRPAPTPKQPKPWDAPPPAKWGDANPNDIYLAVGLALTNWELLEHALGGLFVALILGARSHEAMRAYSAVMANSARLDMLMGASEAFFLMRDGDEVSALKARTDDLLKAVDGFAARRNEIAHGVIGAMFADDHPFDGEHIPDSSWVLTPSFYAFKKRKMFRLKDTEMAGFSPVYQYASAEINAISSKFRDLRPVADRLALDIRRRRHLERKALSNKPAEPHKER